MKWTALTLLLFLGFPLFASEKPNVLFIIVDDLNDLPLKPEGKPLVPTPHIDELARRGVSFTNAHCNDPICAPSRASMLFGLYPQTSGLYWFENWKARQVLKSSTSLPAHFKKHGYKTFGTGKIYHAGTNDGIDVYGTKHSFGPHPVDGRDKFMSHHSIQDDLFEAYPDMPYKWEQTFGPMSDIPDWSHLPNGKKGWHLYGKPWKYNNDQDRDLFPDELFVDWCADVLQQKHDKPFMLFAGFVKTHTPLYAPQKYFDKFPLDKIELPAMLKNDLEDCAGPLADTTRYGFVRYSFLQQGQDKTKILKQWLQAYMACVSFLDDQVGALIKALDNSAYKDNTIVVFTSDHGFHMGDKNFLYKQSLWDGSTRVPFIISGVKDMQKGRKCNHPVSLIDLYPTLNDLCNLPQHPNPIGKKLDGHSVKPFLMDPDTNNWNGPKVAITALPGKDHMMFRQYEGALRPHFSVRSKDYRYTLCSNGEEELYNFQNDPYEWHNLANNPEYQSKVQELRRELIQLRDGEGWKQLNNIHALGSKESSLGIKDKNFELEFEMQTSLNTAPLYVHAHQLSLPEAPNSWNHYRLMLDANRLEVWINGKFHSDQRIGLMKNKVGLEFKQKGGQTKLKSIRYKAL